MKSLRDRFFDECTDYKYKDVTTENTLKIVCLAPHDLFEWFKKNMMKHYKTKSIETDKRIENLETRIKYLEHINRTGTGEVEYKNPNQYEVGK